MKFKTVKAKIKDVKLPKRTAIPKPPAALRLHTPSRSATRGAGGGKKGY